MVILVLNELKAHRQRPNRIYNHRIYIYFQILAYLVVKPDLTYNDLWVTQRDNLDLKSTIFFFRFAEPRFLPQRFTNADTRDHIEYIYDVICLWQIICQFYQINHSASPSYMEINLKSQFYTIFLLKKVPPGQ